MTLIVDDRAGLLVADWTGAISNSDILVRTGSRN